MEDRVGFTQGLNSDSSRGDRHWFLVQCKPGQNQRARMNLENQGFGCFDPPLKVERIRRGRRETRTESLFPGYLFIHLALSGESWHSIRSTRGVRGLVRFGPEPTPVPDAVIDELWLRAGEERGSVRKSLEPGDRLRINAGPFAGLEGIFKCFDGDERVVVLFSMLNKHHRLTLRVSDVHSA